MSELYKFCAAALIALGATVLLRQAHPPSAELITVFFGVLVISHTLLSLTHSVKYLSVIAQGSRVDEYFRILLKAAGTAYITDITSELCRSVSAQSMASYIEMFGRCEILLMSLPLIGEVLEISFGLLKL